LGWLRGCSFRQAAHKEDDRGLSTFPDEDLIRQAAGAEKNLSIQMSDYSFPFFRCVRLVTTEDVKALDDEE
jgi:hypothetical protein